MRLLTDIYLNLLGVGELVENISAVFQDKLGKKRPQPTGLAGKTAIVTGGNAGVGYATAEALLTSGTDVVLACRSLERANAAAERLTASAASAAATSAATAAAAAAAAAAAGTGKGASHVCSSTSSVAAPPPGSVAVELLDLVSLDSVRAFVGRWRDSGRGLDLLVCNAGIMCPPEREQTADGFELQFQSNFLSHFLLVNELVQLQRQRRSQHEKQQGSQHEKQQGKQQGKQHANKRHHSGGMDSSSGFSGSGSSGSGSGAGPLRVIWLTSMTHFGGDLAGATSAALDDVARCPRRYYPFQAYANSKLCTLLASKHLDRRFQRDAQVAGTSSGGACTGAAHDGAAGAWAAAAEGRDVSVAVHPGLVDTALARNYFKGTVPRLLRPLSNPFFDRIFCPYLLRSPGAAAATVLFAATAPAEEVGGAYVGTAPQVGHHSSAAGDPALAQRLWQLSAHLCRLGEGEVAA